MELVDRYIYEVGRHLPRKSRADIQTELRSLILDSLENTPSENLGEDRVASVLREFGPPQEVAASYWPKHNYLIGPDLYPLFRLVTVIVLLAVLGSLLLAMGIGAFFSPEPVVSMEPQAVIKFLAEIFGSLMSTFGALVLTFAILQRFNVRPELDDREWDPESLPEIVEDDQVKRTETVIGMAFALVILAILWFFPNIVGFTISWGQEIIVNPVIVENIPLISIALMLGIGLDLVLLGQGHWTMGTRLAKIGINLFGIFVLYQLFIGHNAWLAANGVGDFFSSLEALGEGITSNAGAITFGMQAFRLAFAVALIVSSIETIVLIYQFVKRMILNPARVVSAG